MRGPAAGFDVLKGANNGAYHLPHNYDPSALVVLPGAPSRAQGVAAAGDASAAAAGDASATADDSGEVELGEVELGETRRFSDGGFGEDAPPVIEVSLAAATGSDAVAAAAAANIGGDGGGRCGRGAPPADDNDGKVSSELSGEQEPSSARDRAAEDSAIEELSKSIKPDRNLSPGAPDADEVGQFFKSVAAVSRAEEVLVAQHKEAVEADELLLQQERMMIEDLKDADGCSVDEYASALEKVLAAKFRICSELQARLNSLKEHMANEEALSARVKQVPLY